MVDLSLADSFLAHHCVLILGWLLILAVTFTFMSGDGQMEGRASGAIDRPAGARNPRRQA